MAWTIALLAASSALAVQSGSLGEAAQAFDDAQFRQDAAAIGVLLAPDFQFVTSSGKRLGREDFLAATADPGETLQPFEIADRRVLPLGADGGVASGDAIVRGTRGGQPFVSHFRYSDVFARRDGRWVVVYTQVTGLPASKP